MTRPNPELAGSKKQCAVLVIHGPNLDLLGSREPATYGRDTLDVINNRLVTLGSGYGAKVEAFQSNHEGALIDRVHAAKSQGFTFIVINPAGLTHTSVSLRDALAGVDIPFIEVHLSNIYKREAFRAKSFFSDLAVGTVSGLGSHGYDLALRFVLEQTP
jgi:3-dehydroquinate dehydratase-2